MCGLTVLLTDAHHRASKTFLWQADGQISKIDFDLGYQFNGVECAVTDLSGLAEVVELIRSQQTSAILVRGALSEDARRKLSINPNHKVNRRKNDRDGAEPASLIETPRQWVMFDLDDYPIEPDLPFDQPLIDQVIRAVLPEPFHDAACYYQFSNSCGFKPGILKVHLFFWLSRAYDNEFLRAWCVTHAPLIDIHVFNAVQPHFVADPIIKSGSDPIPHRTGWREGHPEVSLNQWEPPHQIRASHPPTQRDTSVTTGGGQTDPLMLRDVIAALEQIPHLNQRRSDWFEIACAVYHATNGSLDGYEAWRAWSVPCPSYHPTHCATLWDSLRYPCAHRITAGTLWFRVIEANPDWVRPSSICHRLRLFHHKS